VATNSCLAKLSAAVVNRACLPVTRTKTIVKIAMNAIARAVVLVQKLQRRGENITVHPGTISEFRSRDMGFEPNPSAARWRWLRRKPHWHRRAKRTHHEARWAIVSLPCAASGALTNARTTP
jgi:hypothetical protein